MVLRSNLSSLIHDFKDGLIIVFWLGNEEENNVEILDADHVTMQIDPSDQELDEEVNNWKNISKKTTLRFHLKKRSKTVQGLLEKMFENELKEEDQNGF